jgi:PncC family amidohydrolase
MRTNKEIVQAVEKLRDHLIKNSLTIAVAESVTSGYLQAAFSLVEETGRFFHGGITAYNLGQKVRHLHIDSIRAEACNCVSGETAGEMALGSLALFSSNVAISITGYAAPFPEIGIKKIFAWYAVAMNGKLLAVEKITSAKKEPEQVQIDYVRQVLQGTCAVLLSKRTKKR